MNPNLNMNNIKYNIEQLKLEFMQMGKLLQDLTNLDAEDILPYIDEPKMVLKFSNIDTIKTGNYINVKIPKSLTKKELYSIAKKYQIDYYSNIILSCNNYLLQCDDTLIEGISEGSIINIIEDVDFPDGSYYKVLMKKHEN